MQAIWPRFPFKLAAAVLLAGLMVPAHAQVTCTLGGVAPSLVRLEGNTELLSDIVLNCTGGLPTPAGEVVPQVNITVFLNTNATSRATSSTAAFGSFSEALLLIDEPNAGSPPGSVALTRPLLNCGNAGAPDIGPSGPAVCSIISTGNPLQTYDGTPSAGPPAVCFSAPGNVPIPSNVYGCGRPNAYQGRLTPPPAAIQDNVIEFLGVPFDPPGAGGNRVLRFTNLRASAATIGVATSPISAIVAISGSTAFTFPPGTSNSTPPINIGFIQPGLVSKVEGNGVVRLTEGFASSWKPRNVATALANSSFVSPNYLYNTPEMNYPAQAAQNVPGILYNTEDAFQWQNNGVNKPPSPDPPLGYSTFFTSNLNYPLNSLGLGGVNTGINGDGISQAGTRLALNFVAFGETVTVPSFVYLHRVGVPAVNSGVAVLTTTDPNGAGPFTPGASTTIHNFGTAVYEVLYADPFAIEYADVPVAITGLHAAIVTATLAPAYFGSATGQPSPTLANPTPTAIPRFRAEDATVMLLFSFPSIGSFF
jgi:hypothetical protein